MPKILMIEVMFPRSGPWTIPDHYMEGFENRFLRSPKFPSARGIALGEGFRRFGCEVIFSSKAEAARRVREEMPDLVLSTIILDGRQSRSIQKFAPVWFWYRDVYYPGWEAKSQKFAKAVKMVRQSAFSSATALRTCGSLEKRTTGKVHFFLEPVDTDWFHPDRTPKEKKHDVCFFGTRTKHRDKMFDAIKQKFSLAGHGKSWGHGMMRHYRKFPQSMSAKINLNLAWNKGWPCTPSTRTPWIMSSVGFMLSERGDMHPFKEGEHMAMFEGREELLSKIAHYLEYPVEREEIARRGMEFVRRRYSCRETAIGILHIARLASSSN